MFKKILISLFIFSSILIATPANTDAQDAAVIRIGVISTEDNLSVDDSGNIGGLNIELVNLIIGNAGYTVEWVNLSEQSFNFPIENFSDLGVDATIINLDKPNKHDNSEAGYILSDPYLINDRYFYVNAENPVDLTAEDKILGVVGQGENEQTVIYFDTLKEALQAVVDGDIDLVRSNGLNAHQVLANDPSLAEALQRYTMNDDLYMLMIDANQSEMIEKINKGIASLSEDENYPTVFEELTGLTLPDNYFNNLRYYGEVHNILGIVFQLSADMTRLPAEELDPLRDTYENVVAPTLIDLNVPAEAETLNTLINENATLVYEVILDLSKPDLDFNDIRTIVGQQQQIFIQLRNLINITP